MSLKRVVSCERLVLVGPGAYPFDKQWKWILNKEVLWSNLCTGSILGNGLGKGGNSGYKGTQL